MEKPIEPQGPRTWQQRAVAAMRQAISKFKAAVARLSDWIKEAVGRITPTIQDNSQLVGVVLVVALLLASLGFVWRHCRHGIAVAEHDSKTLPASSTSDVDTSSAPLTAIAPTPAPVRRSQSSSVQTSAGPITAPTWGTTDLDRAISAFPSSTQERIQ